MKLLVIPSCEGHYPRIYIHHGGLSAECKICDSKVSAYNIEGLSEGEIDQLINHDDTIVAR